MPLTYHWFGQPDLELTEEERRGLFQVVTLEHCGDTELLLRRIDDCRLVVVRGEPDAVRELFAQLGESTHG